MMLAASAGFSAFSTCEDACALLHVQQDAHGHFWPLERQHAQRIEAAEVRADEQHALAAFQHAIELRQTGRADVETLEALAEQEQPVENRARRSSGCACSTCHDDARRPNTRSRYSARGAPLRPATKEEIQRDRVQKRARRAPAADSARYRASDAGRTCCRLPVARPTACS